MVFNFKLPTFSTVWWRATPKRPKILAVLTVGRQSNHVTHVVKCFCASLLPGEIKNQKLTQAGENPQLSWQVMNMKQYDNQLCLAVVALPLRWKVMVHRYIYLETLLIPLCFCWVLPFLPFCNHYWKYGLSATISFPDQGPVEEFHNVKVSFQTQTLLQQELPLFFLPFVNVARSILHEVDIGIYRVFTYIYYLLVPGV